MFDIYLPVVDGALIFDNSHGKHELLAQKTIDGQPHIIHPLKRKILIGLEKAYPKLIEYKKQKNSGLVVLRNNKIVKLKPKEPPHPPNSITFSNAASYAPFTSVSSATALL